MTASAPAGVAVPGTTCDRQRCSSRIPESWSPCFQAGPLRPDSGKVVQASSQVRALMPESLGSQDGSRQFTGAGTTSSDAQTEGSFPGLLSGSGGRSQMSHGSSPLPATRTRSRVAAAEQLALARQQSSSCDRELAYWPELMQVRGSPTTRTTPAVFAPSAPCPPPPRTLHRPLLRPLRRWMNSLHAGDTLPCTVGAIMEIPLP